MVNSDQCCRGNGGGGYGGCCSRGDSSENYCNGLHGGSKDGGGIDNVGGSDHSGNKSSVNPDNNCGSLVMV